MIHRLSRMLPLAMRLHRLGWMLFMSVIFQSFGTDWTVAIFYLDSKADQGGYLYPGSIMMFVNSFLANHNTARLALVTDNATAGHLPACTWSYTTRCTLLPVADALLAADARGFIRRASVYVRRYYLNTGAVNLLARDPRSGLGPNSLMLLTDARDVVFEDDIFARIRSRNDSLLRSEEPLFFAIEPWPGPIKTQGWNNAITRQCFGPEVADRLGDMPITCSGTTAGSLTAVRAYIAGMRLITQFCGGPGRKLPVNSIGGGVDQPAHFYLLYDAIMGRRGEQDWFERYGSMFQQTLEPDAIRHPFRDGPDPVHDKLRSLTTELFSGQQRVVPIPLYGHEAEICTFARYGPPPSPFTAAEMGENQRWPTSAPSAPHCALIHMYDRVDSMVRRYVSMYTDGQVKDGPDA